MKIWVAWDEFYTLENEFDDNIAFAAARIKEGMTESAREWLRQAAHIADELGWTLIANCVRKEISDLSEAR